MKKIFHQVFRIIASLMMLFSFSILPIRANDLVNMYRDMDRNGEKEIFIDTIDQNGKEDDRFEFLSELSSVELARFLEELFRPEGGEAIKHWAYNPLFSTKELEGNGYYHKEHDHESGFEQDHFYITPAVRASQYIIFFLDPAHLTADPEMSQKERAKKIAEALNLMDSNRAIKMLYGRFDARFLGDRDRLVRKEKKSKEKNSFKVKKTWPIDYSDPDMANLEVQGPVFSNFLEVLDETLNKRGEFYQWNYEVYTLNGANKYYHSLDRDIFDANTVEARLPLKYIRLLVPYLSDELLKKSREQEDEMSYKRSKTDL
ncbi:MAG: hypothetical protein C5B43_02555 [Verrucomicrobia bacterium]|nr:MAG: hypothetical protein C5B43_02555 [Verrucomicrobiota bacterium]